MKLAKKLDEWVTHKLITTEQRGKITDYEQKQDETDKRIQYAFMGLGGLVIGIGLISLIAYNWAALGHYIKLIGGFLILLGFAGAYIKAENRKSTGLAELFLMLFYFSCLGYIGLVAQVFNLYDQPHRGFLFWNLISLPLILISTRAFLPFLWFISFFTTIAIEAAHHDFIRVFAEKFILNVEISLFIMFALMFQFIIWRLVRMLFKKFEPARVAFSFYMVLGMLLSFWNMDALSIIGFDNFVEYFNNQVNYLFLISALVAITACWFLVPKTEKVFFRSVLILFYIFFIADLFFDLNRYFYAIFNLVAMTSIAVYGALNERRWLFNLMMTFIVIRIIILYLMAFNGLLETGLWLISSGIAVITVIILWSKYKPLIEKKFKEFLQ